MSNYLYLNPTDYVERIEAFKTVHNIEYEFTTFRAENGFMVPALNRVTRQKFKVFYDYRIADRGLIGDLKDYITKYLDELDRFNITGRDDDGNEVTYRLDQPSVFSEMEFDDFQIDFELKHQDTETALQSSHNLQELLKLTRQPEVAAFFNAPEVRE